MKNKLTVAFSLLLSSAFMLQSLPANACAFDTTAYFSYPNHPDLPLNPYAAGELGIVDNGYARSYLLAAYRYFSGHPLTADEQAALVKMWNYRLTTSDYGCNTDTSAWLKARVTVPGAKKIDQIDTDRPINKDESWETYCNCQTSAFVTAAKTLGNLIAQHGASSNDVKEWLQAQDAVFSNCGYPTYEDKPHPAVIPVALPASASTDMQADRAYQIAAANFYSQNFPVATKQFEAIAADANSPWKKIAGYLAVRSMLREASLAKQLNTPLLKEAQAKLKQLSTDAAYADMATDMAQLNSFIAARIEPEQHLDDLAKEKITFDTAAELTKTIDNLLGENQGLDAPPNIDNQNSGDSFSKMNPALRKLDLTDWMLSFQSSEAAAKKYSLDKWKQMHSLPWLVAAVSSIDGNDANAPAVIAAAEHEMSSPAHWTLFYEVNRLKLDKGQGPAVRDDLDKVLSSPPADLPPSGLNALKTQRLTLARNLDEFIRFGVQKPVSICSNGGTEGVPDDMDKIAAGQKPDKTTPVFTPEAGDVINNKMPLSMLQQLAANTSLPEDLRNNVAWTSFVRAILVGDDTAAQSLARIMRPLNKSRQPLVDAYLAAGTPDARKFAAAFMMLQYSSANPNPTFGPLSEDKYGDASGWWWWAHQSGAPEGNEDEESAHPVKRFEPLFITAAQRAQAKKELAKIDAVPGAPDWFAPLVFAWVKTHPTDPRSPQALHWLVKATHYGATSEHTSQYSKEAFQILHKQYATSPWTKKTPYYY